MRYDGAQVGGAVLSDGISSGLSKQLLPPLCELRVTTNQISTTIQAQLVVYLITNLLCVHAHQNNVIHALCC